MKAVVSEFRWIVFGLATAFLVTINVSVVLLLRMSVMILRPMERLVAATDLLAHNEFGTRVQIDGNDEFDQLARAFNVMAERLEGNERRRIETLQQVAVAVNHELNNCIATINYQLRLAGRYAPDCPGLDKSLRQIDQSLSRMTASVQSLKNIRRIVLTDYLPGTKMLDLQRSVELESPDRVSREAQDRADG